MPRPFPSNVSTGGVPVSDGGPGITRPGDAGPPTPGFTASVDLAGSSSAQTVVGFRGRPLSDEEPSPGDSYVFDGVRWVPAVPPGSVLPLSRTLYVDGTTEVPSGQRDGSIAKPYGKIHLAAEHIGDSDPSMTDWEVIIGPGIYAADDTEDFIFVPPGRNVTFEGSSREVTSVIFTYSAVPTFYVVGLDSQAAKVVFRNMALTVAYALDGAAGPLTLRFENCDVLTLRSSTNLFPTVLYADVEAFESNLQFPASDNQYGDLLCDFCEGGGDFEADYAEFRNCDMEGDGTLRGEVARLIGTTWDTGEFGFQNGPGVLEVDGTGSRDFVVVNGVVRIADLPRRRAVRTTTDADPETVELVAEPLEFPASLVINVWATATDQVTGDSAGFHLCAAYKKTAALADWDIVGAPSVVHEVRDDLSWSFDLTTGLVTANATLVGDATNPVVWTVEWDIASRPFSV